MYTFCDSAHILPNGELNVPESGAIHDDEAEHDMNNVCDRQSAWEVLRERPDFDPSKL